MVYRKFILLFREEVSKPEYGDHTLGKALAEHGISSIKWVRIFFTQSGQRVNVAIVVLGRS